MRLVLNLEPIVDRARPWLERDMMLDLLESRERRREDVGGFLISLAFPRSRLSHNQSWLDRNLFYLQGCAPTPCPPTSRDLHQSR